MKNLSFINMLFWNMAIIALWHVAVFSMCTKRSDTFFDPSKGRFAPREWEHGGRWYRDNLKIQVWKDRLPQYIGHDGFSKAHLTDLSIDYLDQFIVETCRGEWMHLKNCICAILLLLINPLLVGLIASFFVLLGNFPFALVQRYNRFRLQTLRKRKIREQRQGGGFGQNTVTA